MRRLIYFFFFLTPLSTWGAESIPVFTPTLNWNYPLEKGFLPYESISSGHAVFNLQKIINESDGSVSFVPAATSFNQNPLLRGIFRFPLYPLLPMNTNPLEIRFFNPQLSPTLPDFFELLEEEHFVWKPLTPIQMIQGPLGGHTRFEFPPGMTFIHRLILKDGKRTPVEMRYIQLDFTGQWRFGVYDLARSEMREPIMKLRTYSRPADRIRSVAPFDHPRYGRMSFSYPAAGPADCVTCHSAGIDLTRTPLTRIQELKNYIEKVRASGAKKPEELSATLSLPFYSPAAEKVAALKFRPCGFVEEGDLMPFYSKVNAWAARFKEATGVPAFSKVSYRRCSLEALKIKQVFTIEKLDFIDHLSNAWITFQVKEKNKNNIVAEPVHGEFSGLTLNLQQLNDQSLTYELHMPGGDGIAPSVIHGVAPSVSCEVATESEPPRRSKHSH